MDISLYYQEKGKGMPFVLLHGNGEDGSIFSNQMEYFSSIYRMIAVDTRWHGKSPRGSAPFTMEQFAEDLNNLLIKLKLSKIILLGFSDGANIAMKFAIKYPEKLQALILNSGNLTTHGIKAFTQFFIDMNYKILKAQAKKSESKKREMEIWGLMINEPNIEAEQLNRITAPTLVIVGSKDMVKESHSKEIADSIPNARLSIIKGNHFIAQKSPNEFNQEVENFLKKIS